MEEADSVTSKQDEFDARLNSFEARDAGLPAMGAPEEAESTRILNLTAQQRRAMDEEDCGQAASTLAGFALHLQRVQNREQARLDRLVECIDRLVAKDVDTVKGWSFDERKLKAVRLNQTAAKLDAERVFAKAKLTRVSYLASRVEFLARTFLELQASKRRGPRV